jgi:hypothetical protein
MNAEGKGRKNRGLRKMFQAEGTPYAKALRQEGAGC